MSASLAFLPYTCSISQGVTGMGECTALEREFEKAVTNGEYQCLLSVTTPASTTFSRGNMANFSRSKFLECYLKLIFDSASSTIFVYGGIACM